MAEEPRGTSGWVVFAATMMFLSSISNLATGMTFIFNSDWALLNADGDFVLDVKVLGWINLGIGVLLIAGGWGVLKAMTWARIVGVLAGAILMINGLMTLPVYTGWGFVMIALGVMVIYALTVKGSVVAPEQEVVGPGGGSAWGAGSQTLQQKLPGEEEADNR